MAYLVHQMYILPSPGQRGGEGRKGRRRGQVQRLKHSLGSLASAPTNYKMNPRERMLSLAGAGGRGVIGEAYFALDLKNEEDLPGSQSREGIPDRGKGVHKGHRGVTDHGRANF